MTGRGTGTTAGRRDGGGAVAAGGEMADGSPFRRAALAENAERDTRVHEPSFAVGWLRPAAVALVALIGLTVALGCLVEIPVTVALPALEPAGVPADLPPGQYVVAVRQDGSGRLARDAAVRVLPNGAAPVPARVVLVESGVSGADLAQRYGVGAPPDRAGSWSVAVVRWDSDARVFSSPGESVQVAVGAGSEPVGRYLLRQAKGSAGGGGGAG